jgi:hypothetical protein
VLAAIVVAVSIGAVLREWIATWVSMPNVAATSVAEGSDPEQPQPPRLYFIGNLPMAHPGTMGRF